MKKWVLILLAALLLICLFDMPYGYYMFIRYLFSFMFGILTYGFFEGRNKKGFLISLFMTILFQPFIMIPLGRGIWQVIDVIVALSLIYRFFYICKKERDNS